MDSPGNMNHSTIIVGFWISDSNYEQALCMTREALDLICSPSIGEEQVVNFETPGNLKFG